VVIFVHESIISDLKKYPIVYFQKNSYIIRQGDSIEYVYFLLKGHCKRNTFTSKGDEIIYDFRSANSTINCFLGALTVYLPKAIHPTNFIAQTKCVCYKLTKQEFVDFLFLHPSLFHDLLYLVMDRYSFLDQNFQSKQKQSTANRVCSLLAENLYEKDNAYYVKNYLTNSEISRYLGCHRVTIVKIMKQLALENVLEKTPEGVLIKDIEQLLIYARDEDVLHYTNS